MLNRRDTLKLTGAGATAVAFGFPSVAAASTEPGFAEIVQDFTGGAEISDGGVSIKLPEIAENGFVVPLEVSAESPMTKEAYVQEIAVLAPLNPNIRVAVFKFSELSGEAAITTRIRLARTQEVVAIAKMSDGTFRRGKQYVRVTVGGCGA